MPARRTLLTASLLGIAQTRGATRLDAQTLDRVRIGQASAAVSYLPLQTARALETFPAAGLDLYWTTVPGGGPACLAALDRGDIDLAAIGADALMAAVSKGQPVQIVASLMGKVPLELVVGNRRIEQAGIAPADDALDKRLSVLKGAVFGVGTVGGAQDRAARWLARQAGLDPRNDIQVGKVGPPRFIQAALEAGRIDAFVLPPPEGLLAEGARTGQVLIRMGDEFPALRLPSLVLAVRSPVSAQTRALAIATCAALRSATAQLLADPAAVAARLAAKLYPRIRPEVIAAAVDSLANGIAARGRLDPEGIAALVAYAGDASKRVTAEGGFWTNAYWDAAAP